jgi:hypothetical protein
MNTDTVREAWYPTEKALQDLQTLLRLRAILDYVIENMDDIPPDEVRDLFIKYGTFRFEDGSFIFSVRGKDLLTVAYETLLDDANFEDPVEALDGS